MRRLPLSVMMTGAFVGLLLLAAACKKKQEPPPGVVAIVAERNITLDDFKHYLDRNAGAELGQIAPEAASALLDQYIEEALISHYAERHGVDVSAEKVAEAVRNDPGSTVMEKRDQLRRTRLVGDLMEKLPPPSDDEVRRYYEMHPEEFNLGERVHARQILVHDEDLAGKILEQLRRGVAFELLSSEYSTAPNASQGGDIGYVTRGQLPQVFEDELFRLRPGGTSNIIKTDSGYHLFKVDDYQQAGPIAFDAAAPAIRARLREEQLNQRLVAQMARARSEIPVTVLAKRLPFPYSGSLAPKASE